MPHQAGLTLAFSARPRTWPSPDSTSAKALLEHLDLAPVAHKPGQALVRDASIRVSISVGRRSRQASTGSCFPLIRKGSSGRTQRTSGPVGGCSRRPGVSRVQPNCIFDQGRFPTKGGGRSGMANRASGGTVEPDELVAPIAIGAFVARTELFAPTPFSDGNDHSGKRQMSVPRRPALRATYIRAFPGCLARRRLRRLTPAPGWLRPTYLKISGKKRPALTFCVMALDTSPVGPGWATVMLTVPTVFKSVAGMNAVNCVLFTKVVTRSAPSCHH